MDTAGSSACLDAGADHKRFPLQMLEDMSACVHWRAKQASDDAVPQRGPRTTVTHC